MPGVDQIDAVACDPGLVASLGKIRGFLVEHEIGPSLPAEGDLTVEVFSPSGESVGFQNLDLSAAKGPIHFLAEFAETQPSEERESLLVLLELLEAQLLGCLLAQPDVAEFFKDNGSPCVYEVGQLLRVAEEWMDLVAPPDDNLLHLSSSLLSVFRTSGLAREHRSELVSDGLTWWRSAAIDPPRRRFVSYIEGLESNLTQVRRSLLEGNVRLVAAIAKKHRRELDFQDGFKAGLIGLTRALDRFDVSRGLKLSTYATWWIRQAISRARFNYGVPVRIPVHLSEQVDRLKRAVRLNWRPRKSHNDVLLEASVEMGVDVSRASFLLSIAEPTLPAGRLSLCEHRPIQESLFDRCASRDLGALSPSSLESASDLLDRIYLELEGEEKKTERQIEKKEREVDILKRRLGCGMPRHQTLETIATDYRVTRERIRQIEMKTLERLRKRYRGELVLLRSVMLGDRHE